MAEIDIRLTDADVERIAARVAELLDDRPAAPADDRLISEPEAAARFSVDRHVLRDARKRGEITHCRVGRFVRYRRQDLEEYTRRCLRPSISANPEAAATAH